MNLPESPAACHYLIEPNQEQLRQRHAQSLISETPLAHADCCFPWLQQHHNIVRGPLLAHHHVVHSVDHSKPLRMGL